jgi:hypothetical protein
MFMKSFVFIIAFMFGIVFSGLAQTNIIEWQTNWPAGGSNALYLTFPMWFHAHERRGWFS